MELEDSTFSYGLLIIIPVFRKFWKSVAIMSMEEGYERTTLEGEFGGEGFVEPLSLYNVDDTEIKPLWNHLFRNFTLLILAL
jgi:hypothetical protein